MRVRKPRFVLLAAILTTLLLTACGGLPTSPYSVTTVGPATKKDSYEGKDFNKFFPKEQAKGEWDFVFGADKTGYAEGTLKKNSKTAALLSITDTVNEPSAKDKFKNSVDKIDGYPVGVSDSALETAILVGDRFQVKVRTMPPATNTTFGKADREEWLKKFDLAGLAQLAK